MSTSSGDAWIDDALKNVRVPAELLPKLQAIVSLDDAELDRALCDVRVPPGLLNRLQSIGSLDEVDLNDELRHVVLPVSLADRLRRIPQLTRRIRYKKATVNRLAIAASLLLAAGIGYLAAFSSSRVDRSQDQPNKRDAIAIAPAQKATNGPNSKHDDRRVEDVPPSLESVAKDRFEIPQFEPFRPSPPELADMPAPTATRASDSARPSLPDGMFGASTTAEEFPFPRLSSMPTPVWRGVTPPRVPGYDLTFQLKHGVHPFVSPAANPALTACQIPLVTSTASFDWASQLAQERKLPPAYRIRTEEFLAGMEYGFALPEDRAIGIRTAAGPSPWGTSNLSLLQVAAQAGVAPRGRDSAAHVVVVLDSSASMRWEHRWEIALSGLVDFAERMQQADRLSLVVAGQGPKIVAERQPSAETVKALKSLYAESLAPDVNVIAAIAKATETANRGSSGAESTARIVLLTDGLDQLDDAAHREIEQLLQAAQRKGHRFDVLDVRQEETIDAGLNRIAAMVDGANSSRPAVRHAGSANNLRWALAEAATGRSQLVAADASMKVTFKPDAVAMYRLLGHEATSVAGLLSAAVETDLRSGEAATGLFEVELKPDGGETIATVEVTWRTPGGGVQTARQTISRLQVASSFYEAPLSLQIGALAAETAEILRDSVFAPPKSHSLAAVAELGRHLSPRLQSRPSFARLMTLVEQAQRSQPVAQ